MVVLIACEQGRQNDCDTESHWNRESSDFIMENGVYNQSKMSEDVFSSLHIVHLLYLLFQLSAIAQNGCTVHTLTHSLCENAHTHSQTLTHTHN